MPRLIGSLTIVTLPLALCLTDARAAGQDDACALLTQGQVSAALNASSQAGKQVGVRMCQWEAPNARVLLTVFGQMGSLSPVDRFNNSKMAIPNIAKTPVSGVGDDAIFIPTMGLALNVRSGSSVFQIRVSGRKLSTDQIKQIEITLAKQAISRL